MNTFKLLAAAAALALILASGAPAVARQADPAATGVAWDKKRLERLERNLRRVERALNQNNAAGTPTLIEPDPEVVALTARVEDLARRLEDLEGANQRQNAALDERSAEITALRRQLTQAAGQIDVLTTRLAESESKLAAQEEAAAQSQAIGETTAGDPAADFQAAMQLMLDGEYAGAGAAFEAFVQRWPDAPQAAEANYRLGETRYLREDFAGAAAAYATALQGWPRARWASEATLKLAAALNGLKRDTHACGALKEFDRRYAAGSPTALRGRAAALKTRAKCA
jgi:tol-pal system protein YbgF